jgi:hypothetical protein
LLLEVFTRASLPAQNPITSVFKVRRCHKATRFLMWLNTLPRLGYSVKVALKGRGFRPNCSVNSFKVDAARLYSITPSLPHSPTPPLSHSLKRGLFFAQRAVILLSEDVKTDPSKNPSIFRMIIKEQIYFSFN